MRALSKLMFENPPVNQTKQLNRFVLLVFIFTILISVSLFVIISVRNKFLKQGSY